MKTIYEEECKHLVQTGRQPLVDPGRGRQLHLHTHTHTHITRQVWKIKQKTNPRGASDAAAFEVLIKFTGAPQRSVFYVCFVQLMN